MVANAKFWDNAAEKYAKSPIGDMKAYEYTLGRTRTYLSPTDNVLEVGCGTGSTALLLAGNVKHITATDLSSEMIKIATQKAKDQNISNVTFTTAEMLENKADKELYDVVLAHNILHLLEDIPAALRKINGVLKPGGTFISKTVCDPGPNITLKMRLIKMVLPLAQFFGKAPYVEFMDVAELEARITAAGFKIVETGNHPVTPLPSRYIVANKT